MDKLGTARTTENAEGVEGVEKETLATAHTASTGLYKFQPYDARIAPSTKTGNRLAKALYRAPREGSKEVAKENSYIEIPSLKWSDIEGNLEEWKDYFLGYVEGLQDGIIKERHKSGSTELSATVFSASAVLDQLASSENSRLNGDTIKAWFDTVLNDPLVALFSAKLGLDDNCSDEELQRLAAIVETYKNLFAKLASGKTKFIPAECEKLQKALTLSLGNKLAEDDLGSRFFARLETMKTAKANDLLMEL